MPKMSDGSTHGPIPGRREEQMGGGGGDEARAGEFTWYDISFSVAFTYYIVCPSNVRRNAKTNKGTGHTLRMLTTPFCLVRE